MIYEPDEDSFLIGEFLKKLTKGKKVLDVGCGSGYLAKIAIENNAKEVDAVDINEEAVDYCDKQGINAWKSNLFSKVDKKYDLIVFNPPYLPEDVREDEESRVITTGGKKGSEILVKFLSKVRNYLNVGGKVLVVISSLTGKPDKLFKDFKVKALGKKKLFFEELTVYLLK